MVACTIIRAQPRSDKTSFDLALVLLAIDGLVSFSGYPLRLVTYLGFATVCLALIMLAWVLTDALYNRTAPRGWASTLVAVLFMGSIQLFSLGIIGEYIRLIFLESKRRPTYVVRDFAGEGAGRRGATDPEQARSARGPNP